MTLIRFRALVAIFGSVAGFVAVSLAIHYFGVGIRAVLGFLGVV